MVGGATVIGSWIRPWMWRLTRATSLTCSFGGHVVVDEAHAAVQRHGDRHPRTR